MKRDIYSHLQSWKNDPNRKPLILRGARQVGKTYILKEFGEQNYARTVYLNFELQPKLKNLFETNLDPVRIIRDISLLMDQQIEPQNTLIFFDEIQECPNALTALKYFQEQAIEYHIVCAGSLLGITISQAKGFPVGKVTFLELYPCCFFEFLDAIGQSQLRQFLEELTKIEPLTTAIHEKLIGLLKIYYLVGGMPEVINTYKTNHDLIKVRKTQKDIIDTYILDFSKHAPGSDVIKINNLWNNIPQQLAKENKKFSYTALQKGARAREYETSIRWLIDAGLALQSYCISTPKLPIASYHDPKAFKIFLLDVGLLCAMADLSAKTLLSAEQLFTEFKGALTENYVAQQLKAKFNSNLYYWSSQGKAEVDFILQLQGEISPLEVKSGTSTKQKSLNVYKEKFQPKKLYRTSLLNLSNTDNFYNFPLYMISLLGSL